MNTSKSFVSALSAALSTAFILFVVYFISSDNCLDNGGRVIGIFCCENAQGVITNFKPSGFTLGLLILLLCVLPFLLTKVFEFVTSNEKET